MLVKWVKWVRYNGLKGPYTAICWSSFWYLPFLLLLCPSSSPAKFKPRLRNTSASSCRATSFLRQFLPLLFLCSLHLHLCGEQSFIIEASDVCRGTEESCRECAKGWKDSWLLHSRNLWQRCNASGAVRRAETRVQEQAAQPQMGQGRQTLSAHTLID